MDCHTESSPTKSTLTVIGIFCVLFLIINCYNLDLRIATSEFWSETIYKLSDPTLYPNDEFGSWHINYTSLFFQIPRMLYALLGITPVISGLFFVFCTVIIWAWAVYNLSMEFFHDKFSAASAAILSLGSPLNSFALAQGTRFDTPLASVFTIALLLVVLLWFIRGSRFKPFLLLALCFYFHLTFSLYALFLLSLVIALKRHEYPIRDYVLPLSVCLFLVLPLLVFLHSIIGTHINKDDFMRLLYLRSAFHHFPSTFGFSQTIFMLLAFILSVKYAGERLKHGTVTVWFAGIAALCIIGTVFVELAPVVFIAKLSLFRSTQFFIVIVTIYFAHYLMRSFQGGDTLMKATVIMFFLTILVLETDKSALFIPVFIASDIAAGQLSFLKTGRIAERRAAGIKNGKNRMTYFTVLSWSYFCIASLISLADLPGKIHLVFGSPAFLLLNQSGFNIIFMASTLVLVAILLSIHTFRCMLNNLAGGWSSALILLSIAVFCLAYQGAWLNRHFNRHEAGAWKDAQLWARQSTVVTDRFIIPFHMWGWRSFSQRSTIGSWADFDYWKYNSDEQIFNAAVERLRDFGYDFKNIPLDNTFDNYGFLAQQYERYIESRFKTLAEKYNARYVVVKRGRALGFSMVYENAYFRIYEIL